MADTKHNTCSVDERRSLHHVIYANPYSKDKAGFWQLVSIKNESLDFWVALLRENNGGFFHLSNGISSIYGLAGRRIKIMFHDFDNIGVNGGSYQDMIRWRMPNVQHYKVERQPGKLIIYGYNFGVYRNLHPRSRCSDDALLSDASLGDALLCLSDSGGSLIARLIESSNGIGVLLSGRLAGLVDRGQGILVCSESGRFGILHGIVEDDIRSSNEYYSQKQEYYRKTLTRSPFIIVDLFLFFCSYKLVGYAVKCSDNLHVILVVLAFPLMVLSVATFLYVIGFWDVLWH